jgi:hypothetical protein
VVPKCYENGNLRGVDINVRIYNMHGRIYIFLMLYWNIYYGKILTLDNYILDD